MTEHVLNTTAPVPAGVRQRTGLISALTGRRRAAVAFATGALSTLGLAPFDLWPLLFLTFPVFVLLLDGPYLAGARHSALLWRAAKTGWWFGFGYFTAGLYWIGWSFMVEADKTAWLAPFAVAGLCAALAIFHGMACAAAAALWRPGAARVVALAAAFFCAEWLRGHVLTGFPWNMPGYALTGCASLMQAASLTGVYGLTFFAVLIFASPAAVAGPSGGGRAAWGLPAMALMLLAAAWIWGGMRLGETNGAVVEGAKLRLVQPNIPQAEKWRPSNRAWIFQRYMDLSGGGPHTPEAGITHVIWPESSLSFLFLVDGAVHDLAARDAMREIIPQDGSLILGALRADSRTGEDGKRFVARVYNSLFVLNGNGAIMASYDKVHLVPFGEYLPFSEIFRTAGFKELVNPAAMFLPGTVRHNVTTPHAPEFAPLICYEAVFPGEVLADGGGRPGWLLNLTDDSWFDSITGPYQHLQQVRVRAVEEGLPVIRVANSGVSAVIDPHGTVRASLPLDTAGRLDVTLPVALSTTFYGRHRNGVLLMIAAFAVACYISFIKLTNI